MPPMLLSMRKLRAVLSVLKPLRIYCLALAISACNNAPPFPTDKIFETSTADNVCGEYKVIDAKTLNFKHVRDWPLEKCNGVFGFSTSDIPKVLRWGEKTQAYVKERCK